MIDAIQPGCPNVLGQISKGEEPTISWLERMRNGGLWSSRNGRIDTSGSQDRSCVAISLVVAVASFPVVLLRLLNRKNTCFVQVRIVFGTVCALVPDTWFLLIIFFPCLPCFPFFSVSCGPFRSDGATQVHLARWWQTTERHT